MKNAKTDPLSLIARALAIHRKRAGLSRRELSVLAQVSESAIFNIEKMKQGVRLETLLKLFSVLNIRLRLEGPFMQDALGGEGGHAQG